MPSSRDLWNDVDKRLASEEAAYDLIRCGVVAAKEVREFYFGEPVYDPWLEDHASPLQKEIASKIPLRKPAAQSSAL